MSDLFYRGGGSDKGILGVSVLDDDRKYSQNVRTAVVNTILVVVSAILFGLGTWYFKGEPSMVAFFTAYLVEQSLSVDNLFVFIMIFDYMKVPSRLQSRVLTWGIVGAVFMRGIMIFLGVAAIERYKFITLVFAAILLVSAYKLFGDEEEQEDLSNNTVMKISKYFIKTTENYEGDRFFTRRYGATVATPLFLCLVCVELSDVVFAIDSIPAVLGVSHDSFVVVTSNIFAIMGLRSLYTLIAKAMSDLPYLRPSVALVLGFVGGKMVLEYFQYDLPNEFSLLVVIVLLGGGVALSYLLKKPPKSFKNFE